MLHWYKVFKPIFLFVRQYICQTYSSINFEFFKLVSFLELDSEEYTVLLLKESNNHNKEIKMQDYI